MNYECFLILHALTIILNSIFSNEKAFAIKKPIVEIDSDFGNAPYVYRSELIHNSEDVCSYNHSWNLMNGKVSLVFFCSKKVLNHFKKIADKSDKKLFEKCLDFNGITLRENLQCDSFHNSSQKGTLRKIISQ
jgi:hypothetical protein